MPGYITDNIEVSYDDTNIEDFDEEISNEEDSDKGNCSEANYLSNVLIFISYTILSDFGLFIY